MNENEMNMDDLLEIMRALRDPKTGCAWDLKQSFESISAYTIEEAYEVVDAIEQGDMRQLCDELGDLLFQIVYHAQLADEKGTFDFNDVIEGICEKLVRRHPHVFKGEKIDEKDLAREWERHKRVEMLERKVDKETELYLLADVPVSLPATRRAYKLQKKASSVGFDWADVAPVIAKLEEEVDELKAELKKANNHQRKTEELGDVLFSCINLARHIDVDADAALRAANHRFIERFNYIERMLRSNGKYIETTDVREMQRLWERAKTMLHDEK